MANLTEDEIQKIMHAPLVAEAEQPTNDMEGMLGSDVEPFPQDVLDEFAELNKDNTDPDLAGAIQPQSTLAQEMPDDAVTPTAPVENQAGAPVARKPRGSYTARKPIENIGGRSAHDNISWRESIELSFRTDNTAFAAVEIAKNQIKDKSISYSERTMLLKSFDPSPHIDPRFIEQYGDQYVGLVTPDEVRRKNEQINIQVNRRARMAKAGLGQAIGSGVIAGILDPITIATLPVSGGTVATAKGISIGRSVAAGVGAGMAVEGATEGILHAADPTRTKLDTAMALGIGGALGGTITGAAAGLKKYGSSNPAADAVDEAAQAADDVEVAKARADIAREEAAVQGQTQKVADDADYVPDNWDNLAVVQKTADDFDDMDPVPNMGQKAADDFDDMDPVPNMGQARNDIIAPDDPPRMSADDLDDGSAGITPIGKDGKPLTDEEIDDMLMEMYDKRTGEPVVDMAETDDGNLLPGRDTLYGEGQLQTGNDFVSNHGIVNPEHNGQSVQDFIDGEPHPKANSYSPQRASDSQVVSNPIHGPMQPEAAASRRTYTEGEIEDPGRVAGMGAVNQAKQGEELRARQKREHKTGGWKKDTASRLREAIENRVKTRTMLTPELIADQFDNPFTRKIMTLMTGSNMYRQGNSLGVANTLSPVERLNFWNNKANKVHRNVKATDFKEWVRETYGDLTGVDKAMDTLPITEPGRFKTEQVSGGPGYETYYEVFRQEVGKAQELLQSGRVADVTNPHVLKAAKKYNEAMSQITTPFRIPESINWSRDQPFLMRSWNTINVMGNTEKFTQMMIRAINQANAGYENALPARRIAEDMIRKMQKGDIMDHNMVDVSIDRKGTVFHDSRAIRVAMTDEMSDFLVLDVKSRTDYFLKAFGKKKEYETLLNDLRARDWREVEARVESSYQTMRETIPEDMIGDTAKIESRSKYLTGEEKESIKMLRGIKTEMFGDYEGLMPDAPKPSVALYNLRKMVTMASLHNLLFTSIPDLGNILREGGLEGFTMAFKAQFSQTLRKANREVLEDLGVVTEHINNKRLNHFIGNADQMDEIQLLGTFSRLNDTAHKTFFVANMATMWNQEVKEMAVGAVQHRMIKMLKGQNRTADGLLDVDKLDVITLTEFARWGFGKGDLAQLDHMIRKYGNQQDGMMNTSGVQNWVDGAAEQRIQRQYIAMLTRISDTTINTPTARSNPRWMGSDLGAMIGQFSSFIYAAHNQTVQPMMQNFNRDRAAGLALSMGVAYIGWSFKQLLAGKDPFALSGEEQFYNTFEASAGLTHFFYAADMLDKFPLVAGGPKHWLGIAEEDSAYVRQRKGYSLAGPVPSKALNLVDATVAYTEGNVERGNKGLRYVTPYANLPWIKLFEAAAGYNSTPQGYTPLSGSGQEVKKKKTGPKTETTGPIIGRN